jgi:imidazole glycerol-phosphate synthase subunit HisH
MEVAIINYGMGNLQSVVNAFLAAGANCFVASQPSDLDRADRFVLPGVGAFGDGMRNLEQAGWIEALERQVCQQGKLFLGLCLGMQMLATTGTEHGHHQGLGWIPGVVLRIPRTDTTLRIPHVGWNDVTIHNNAGLYANLGDVQTFYFVHSYFFRPEQRAAVTSVCCHGSEFAASLEAGNILATQYHPEKSQKAGLAVLRNFLAMRS